MDSNVHFEDLGIAALRLALSQKNYSQVIILVDENTKIHCLPKVLEWINLPDQKVIEIPSGEIHKTIDTCCSVWQKLADFGADRKSILLNIGGGVVTDLGGFVASTYKRGIDFINIPTTLLAMVDASVGGKTGVDFGMLKNQIGVIKAPQAVIIHSKFLSTLEKKQFISGYAEMLKHGLIASEEHWNTLGEQKLNVDEQLIKASVAIKAAIVSNDPYEQGERKKLNFGHTLGHAIESYFLEKEFKNDLLHGEAIAVGMILESYLSHKLCGLSKIEMDEIKTVITSFYPKVYIDSMEHEEILSYMKHDKKNSHGNVNFTLLTAIGHAVFDKKVDEGLFKEAFSYYKQT